MTLKQRDQMKKLRRNMLRMATLLEASAFSFKALSEDEPDRRTRAVYVVLSKITPQLIAECRVIASAVQEDLQADRLREGDPWLDLKRRAGTIAAQCEALSDGFPKARAR